MDIFKLPKISFKNSRLNVQSGILYTHSLMHYFVTQYFGPSTTLSLHDFALQYSVVE